MFKFFKNIRCYWQKRRDRLYFKSRYNLIFDISLGLIILLLLGTLIAINLYRPDLGGILRPTTVQKYNLDLNNPPVQVDFLPPQFIDSLSDEFVLKITLRNDSRIEVKDLKVEILSIDRNVYIDKILLSQDFIKTNSGWFIDGRQILFGNLAPQARFEMPLNIGLQGKVEENKTIKLRAQVEYFVQDQLVKESFDLPIIQITSELNASASAYYHSPQGDQLGSGPLPPLVGLPTNYWIFFRTSGNGDFKNLVFSGQLAPGVELTENRSLLAGNFTYNAARRQVIWTVPEVIADDDSYRLGFEVQLIPAKSQVGESAVLIKDLKYHAVDAVSGLEKRGSLKNIYTDLPDDRLNEGQGIVSLAE